MNAPSNPAVAPLDRAAYQRAARVLLNSPLITGTFPTADALPLIRRWAGPLREDLAELFDYRLDLTATTARLSRVRDAFDPSQPARAGAQLDRPFDRRRYAYLCLALAVLGRAGLQIALSELAERVAGEADRIDGLELSLDRQPDRAGFVDAAGWLEARGAVRLADGSARRWVDDPSAGEALYDIDRDVLRALYRPSPVLQHVDTARALLYRPQGVSRDTRRRESAQRVRRALVERPVAYYADLAPGDRGMLRNPGPAAEVAELTGLVVERRSEGVALLDVSGMFSDRRFPGSGTRAQVALLLANRIADRVLDPDAPELTVLAPDPDRGQTWVRALDGAMPRADLITQFADDSDPADSADPANPAGHSVDEGDTVDDPDGAATAGCPLLEDGWLRSTLTELIDSYSTALSAAQVADPARLLDSALALLAELDMIVRVPGGVLARPLLARYRNAVVSVRPAAEPAGLFDMGG
ncbi:TIGR02678 family protein [Nakamurella sp.]|uniref:TIGR02678 family protein n=1 Tax=Nakamurella sp. TaxID=1869182 RepID=UPI003B3AC2B2